jgi:hypothetical protein
MLGIRRCRDVLNGRQRHSIDPFKISTGATNQNQGQYAFSLSGVNAEQVYATEE